MRYYIDTEFLEGPQKKRFLGMPYGETKPTIDLISIGIVAEDGREYYAISKDFNLKEAWNRYDIITFDDDGKTVHPKGIKKYWIRENVLKPIYYELCLKDEDPLNSKNNPLNFSFKTLKNLIVKYGKTNKQIAEEIKEFCLVGSLNEIKAIDNQVSKDNGYWSKKYPPDFYAYYADYDWVAFCWLFGKMIDLPKGFPKYCIDLKQEMDKIVFPLLERENAKQKFLKGEEYSFEEGLRLFKTRSDYPKQTNEHNALTDARWNKELHEFLKTI